MQRTFNAWVRDLGFKWVGDEDFYKGFMSRSEAENLIRQYEAEGRLTRG